MNKSNGTPIPEEQGKRGINILIVDDHVESLTALEAVLSHPNHHLVKATSGVEALRILLTMDFALILLDVRIPDLTGFEIARLIRQREKTRQVPIIFLTGYSKDTESIAEGYLSGAVDYLLKPVDPEILRAKSSFFIDLYVKNESLKIAGKDYKQLTETAKVVVWRAEAKTLQFTYVSKEAENILGYPVEEWTSTLDFWKDHIHQEDRDQVISAFLGTVKLKTPTELEYRMIAADGRVLWFQNMFRVPEDDLESSVLVGVMLEITERKNAEEVIRKVNEELEQRVTERTAELQRMLFEKEVLLKEIHHRVKNNLQIISSLLNLQANCVGQRDATRVLNECQNRVLSMALIHEKLYQTTDLSNVDFASYIADLASYLFQAFGVGTDRVNLNVHSNVSLHIDLAIPCGLIINELVTNSLKYAFPEDRKGAIVVNLIRDYPGFRLTVSDDGVGLPAQLNPQNPDSLGMRLVGILSTQLHGTLNFDGTSGTRATVVFPDPTAGGS